MTGSLLETALERIDKAKIEVGDYVRVTYKSVPVDGPSQIDGTLLLLNRDTGEIHVGNVDKEFSYLGMMLASDGFYVSKIKPGERLKINAFTLRKQLKELADKEIAPGVIVRVSWQYETEDGIRHAEHVGPLKAINRRTGYFEINPSLNSPGHLRSRLGAGNAKIEKLPANEAVKVALDLRKMTPGMTKVRSKVIRPGHKHKPGNPFVAKKMAKEKPKENLFTKKANR